MFKYGDNYNLFIDSELFGFIQNAEENVNNSTEDLHFMVLAMIGAIAIKNPYAPYIYTTLDNILVTMAQDLNFKAKPKVRTGIMNGFNTLRKYGVIKMNESFTGDKKQVVSITTEKLDHEKDAIYFQLGRKELATIMTSNVPHHLITLMCNYCSRFNGQAYKVFSEDNWHENVCYYNQNPTLYKKLSCWASQDTLTMSWINIDGEEVLRKNKWEVTQAQFSTYCKQLVDLRILGRYVVGFTGGRYSYYFRPIHEKVVIWSVELCGKQQAYVKEQEQEKSFNEVVQKKKSKDNEFEKKLAKLSSKVDYD